MYVVIVMILHFYLNFEYDLSWRIHIARINCASVIPRYSIERITVFFISPRKGTGCNDKKRQIEEVSPRLHKE